MRRKHFRSLPGVFMLLTAVFGVALHAQSNGNAGEMKRLLTKALRYVPHVEPDQVVVIRDLEEVVPHLIARGYEPAIAKETVQQLNGLAEFTLDHRYPIFINAGSWHIRRILQSWRESRTPDQAARVLASDLHHEYLHAARTAGECVALQGHVSLLESWRSQGVLRIADPYITNLKQDLQDRNAQGNCAAPAQSTIATARIR